MGLTEKQAAAMAQAEWEASQIYDSPSPNPAPTPEPMEKDSILARYPSNPNAIKDGAVMSEPSFGPRLSAEKGGFIDSFGKVADAYDKYGIGLEKELVTHPREAAEILASVALPEYMALKGPMAIRNLLALRKAPTIGRRLAGITGESILGTTGATAVNQAMQKTGLREDAPLAQDLAIAGAQAGAGIALPGLVEGGKAALRGMTAFSSLVRRNVGKQIANALGFGRNSVTPREQALSDVAASAGDAAAKRKFFNSTGSRYDPNLDEVVSDPAVPPSQFIDDMSTRAADITSDVGEQIDTFVTDLQAVRSAINSHPSVPPMEVEMAGGVVNVPKETIAELKNNWFSKGVGEDVEKFMADMASFISRTGEEALDGVVFVRNFIEHKLPGPRVFSLQQLRDHLKSLNAFERDAGLFNASLESGRYSGDPSKLPEAKRLADSMLTFAKLIRPELENAMGGLVEQTLKRLPDATGLVAADVLDRTASYTPSTIKNLLKAYGDFKDLGPALTRGEGTMIPSSFSISPKSLTSVVKQPLQTIEEVAIPRPAAANAADKSLVFNLRQIEDTLHQVSKEPDLMERVGESTLNIPAGPAGVQGREAVMNALSPAPAEAEMLPPPVVTPTPGPDLGSAKAAIADAVLKAGQQATKSPMNGAGPQIPQDSLFAPPMPTDMPPPVLGGPGAAMGPGMAGPPLVSPEMPNNGVRETVKPMPRSVEGFFSLPTEAIAPEVLDDKESVDLIVEAQNSAPAVKEQALAKIISKHKLAFQTDNPKFIEYDIIVSDGVPKIKDDLKAAAYRRDLEERESAGKISFADATKYLNAINQSGVVLEFAADAKKLEKAANKPAAPVPTPEVPESGGGDTGSKVYPSKPRAYPF